MNATEERRLFTAIAALLNRASVSDFRYNLSKLVEETKVNIPRRRIFDAVDDLLTTVDMIAEVGDWVMAEVEGTNVQFNLLSENLDEFGKKDTTKGIEVGEEDDKEEEEEEPVSRATRARRIAQRAHAERFQA